MAQYALVKCNINGKDVEKIVDVRASLTDMLRNDFRLTSVTVSYTHLESPGSPLRRSCTSASRTAAGAGSARSRTRRSGSTCRRTGPAGRWRSRGGFSRRRRPNGCARAAKRRFLTSGARRRAGSNTPAAAFPPCRRPVSYTHLDVYKRQPERGAFWVGHNSKSVT